MTTPSAIHDTKHLHPSVRMRAKFARELAALELGTASHDRRIVTEAELERLPLVVQRYLRFMGVLDRPRDVSFRLRWDGQFRMGPDRPFVPCEVWQYNTCSAGVGVARIFHMRMSVAGVVPMYVRDLYMRGGGRMSGKILDTFSIADVTSEEVTIGELVTYLNDALFFAPSMVLGPSTSWSAVGDEAFDVSIVDCGHTVTGRVFVDGHGAMRDFSTTDRFGEEPKHREAGLVRTEWTTPVDGWMSVGGRMRPRAARAVWHYASGDLCYAQLDGARMDIEYDVTPS